MLIHGDCLEAMKDMPDNSVDLCLTDIPYGTTACKWDVVIPFDPMWLQLKRIVKDNGAICLFGSEPFSSHLRLSNLEMFKYDWYYKKVRLTGNLTAKKQPMKCFETVSIFYKKQVYYSPYLNIKNPLAGKGTPPSKTAVWGMDSLKNQKKYVRPKQLTKNNFLNGFPVGNRGLHPTQKPVALLEYLIRTYTLENETVLDFTMGSGSTGVACKNLNRKFIGIEKDEKYFEIAKQRIENCPLKLITDI